MRTDSGAFLSVPAVLLGYPGLRRHRLDLPPHCGTGWRRYFLACVTVRQSASFPAGVEQAIAQFQHVGIERNGGI